MANLVERLTINEIAVVAGVLVPEVHRLIEERILPEDLYSTEQMPMFRIEACVLIAFYYQTAALLTAQARHCAIRDAMAHCMEWDAWKNCIFEDRSTTVYFSRYGRRSMNAYTRWQEPARR